MMARHLQTWSRQHPSPVRVGRAGRAGLAKTVTVAVAMAAAMVVPTIGIMASLLPSASQAQDAYPSRPVRIIVAFPAGSTNDYSARLIAPRMSALMGQSVLVENRLGGGGITGTVTVTRAAPDGYLLLLGTSSQLIYNVGLTRDLPFDPDKDLAAVGLISRSPQVLLAHSSTPGRNVKEMLAYAKANPGKLTYGSGGAGSISHVVPEYFKRLTGTDLLHVPYKGNGPAIVDMLAGRINFVFTSLGGTGAEEHIRNGTLRAYATAGRPRASLPGVRSFADEGVADFDPHTWNAILAPAATPVAIIQRVNRDLNAVLRETEIKSNLEARGSEVLDGSTPQTAASFIAREQKVWVPLIRSLNIQPE